MLAAILQATEHPVPELPGRQKVVAIVLAAIMLLVVVELVRQRKLREEYSIVWAITATGLLILALNYRILVWITELIGAVTPHSTLLFGGILFLLILALQFSVRMSRLTYRLRKLSQRFATLENEVRDLKEKQGEREDAGPSS